MKGFHLKAKYIVLVILVTLVSCNQSKEKSLTMSEKMLKEKPAQTSPFSLSIHTKKILFVHIEAAYVSHSRFGFLVEQLGHQAR